MFIIHIENGGDEKKKKEKKKKEKLKTVGLFEIYRFADKWDAFLMIVGMIGALIAGAVFPVMFYLFGSLTDANEKRY